ncbi:MAG: hypothetical protein ACRDFW_12180 [bacterium]
MTLKDLLLYLLEYTYEKEGAYPPLTALVRLTVAQASWKPARERHSSNPTTWDRSATCARFKVREALAGANR